MTTSQAGVRVNRIAQIHRRKNEERVCFFDYSRQTRQPVDPGSPNKVVFKYRDIPVQSAQLTCTVVFVMNKVVFLGVGGYPRCEKESYITINQVQVSGLKKTLIHTAFLLR